MIVSGLHNVRYLAGFTGSNGAMVLYRDGRAVFFTDPRYTEQSKEQVDCRTVIAKGPLSDAVTTELKKKSPARIGFERDHLTVGQFSHLEKGAPSRSRLIPVSALVEGLRMVKDEDEIELIRTSVKTNSRALHAALKRFKPGMTEAALAGEIDYQSRKLGADGPAFDTIVAAGPRAALPHAQPGSAKIGPGMLLIDMGAFQNGYASDMTRMVHVGEADSHYCRLYTAVLQAEMAGVDAVKAGASTASVDKATRDVLRKHDLDKYFVHSTGHGLGLEIHEAPRLGKKDTGTLQAGMVVTVEPGIYIPGWGGIRIEDTVLVTETGCEILTPTTKALIEI
jgi:Xaa-Pro aminopeptidase